LLSQEHPRSNGSSSRCSSLTKQFLVRPSLGIQLTRNDDIADDNDEFARTSRLYEMVTACGFFGNLHSFLTSTLDLLENCRMSFPVATVSISASDVKLNNATNLYHVLLME
uniref:GCP_N_terminal domain-containing protein n=1 Tax=Haemonchus placei TaxID=6290 RepID=A0A0N4X7J7_HAEPC